MSTQNNIRVYLDRLEAYYMNDSGRASGLPDHIRKILFYGGRCWELLDQIHRGRMVDMGGLMERAEEVLRRYEDAILDSLREE
jgi:hypothetical protein